MRQTTQASGQRWLLAALCLLASLAFTVRNVQPARGVEMWASQAMGSRPGTSAAQRGSPGTGHDHEPVEAVGDDLPEPAPHHAAHCPFCFTAAFAVVSPGTTLVVVRVQTETRSRRRSVQASCVPLRQADPRAPPVSDHPLS